MRELPEQKVPRISGQKKPSGMYIGDCRSIEMPELAKTTAHDWVIGYPGVELLSVGKPGTNRITSRINKQDP
jgi:hypothetical protein